MIDYNAIHRPVLLERCVALITPALRDPGAVVVDCTLGLAGHASAVLHAAPECQLIGIDRDAEALALAAKRIRRDGVAGRFTPVHATFDSFNQLLDGLGVGQVAAVFMDLGLSSLQIDERARGFSYSTDAPLDMRMDAGQSLTAAQVLATYSTEQLESIFRRYGEERFSRRIAREIVHCRRSEEITTSRQLDELVDRVVPRAHRPAGNPAKRVFQALRIEVNGELDKLARTLPQAAGRLRVGGRIVVESYQSLEDRVVKRFMAHGTRVDVPPDMPVVPDDAEPFFRDLTHGAIKADERELQVNPRAASVRLRAVELTRHLPGRWRRRFANESREASREEG